MTTRFRASRRSLHAALFLVACPLLACAANDSPSDIRDTEDPIIGGTSPTGANVASLGQVEVKIALSTGRTQVNCSGSLLNRRWLLTAAHCFHDVASEASSPAVSIIAPTSLGAGGSSTLSVTAHYSSRRQFPAYVATNPESGRDAILLQTDALWPDTVPIEAGFLLDENLSIPSVVTCSGYGNDGFSTFGDYRVGSFLASTAETTAFVISGTVLQTYRGFNVDTHAQPNIPTAFLAQGDSGGVCRLSISDHLSRSAAVISASENNGAGGGPVNAGFVSPPVAHLVAEEAFSFDQFVEADTSIAVSTAPGPWNDIVEWTEATSATASHRLRDYLHIGATSLLVKPRLTATTFGANVMTPISPAFTNVDNVTIANIDNNGLSAVIEVQSSALRIYAPTGTGAFAPQATVSLVGMGWASGETRFVDVTGDAVDDLVNLTSTDVRVLKGTGSPSFFAGNTLPASYKTTNLGTNVSAVASRVGFLDMNNDGVLDYVFTADHALFFAKGNGDGTFASPATQNATVYFSTPPASDSTSNLLLGDFNGDGLDDLAAVEPTAIEIMYALAAPQVGFSSAVQFPMEYGGPWDVTTDDLSFDDADVDGNTVDDILFMSPSGHKVWTKMAVGGGSTLLRQMLITGSGHANSGVARGMVFDAVAPAVTCVFLAPQKFNTNGTLATITVGETSANPVMEACVGDNSISLHPTTTGAGSVPFLHLEGTNSEAATTASHVRATPVRFWKRHQVETHPKIGKH